MSIGHSQLIGFLCLPWAHPGAVALEQAARASLSRGLPALPSRSLTGILHFILSPKPCKGCPCGSILQARSVAWDFTSASAQVWNKHWICTGLVGVLPSASSAAQGAAPGDLGCPCRLLGTLFIPAQVKSHLRCGCTYSVGEIALRNSLWSETLNRIPWNGKSYVKEN